MTMSDIRDWLAEYDGELLCADGFDDAIIGYVVQPEGPPLVLYSSERCIEILIEEGLSEEEAWEHFEYNVRGSYVGERTPLFTQY